MNTLVYNRDNRIMNQRWDGMALRAGLLLTERVYSAGITPTLISYTEMWKASRDFDQHLKTVIHWNDWSSEEEKEKFYQALSVYQNIKKKKHRQKYELVFLKQFERTTVQIYDDRSALASEQFTKDGLTPLLDFNKMSPPLLFLHSFYKDSGEQGLPIRLSKWLSYQYEPDSFPSPDLFVLMAEMAIEARNTLNLIDLIELPNLNILKTDQLLSVREQLVDVRTQLDKLLIWDEPNEQGVRYLNGTWNRAALEKQAARLKQQFEAVPEIKWALSLSGTERMQLSLGQMDTTVLWNMLNKHGQLPPDTWEVLQQTMNEGNHCPHVPIMTLTQVSHEKPTNDLSMEEFEQFKRKTIDID